MKLATLVALLALASGCATEPTVQADLHDFSVEVEDDTENSVSILDDVDGAQVDTDLEVQELEVAAGVDVLLDWSELSVDLWGRPLDPLLDARRATLYHFTIDDLELLLDGLVNGDLSQSVVGLQVSCESETASCYLSEFAFMMGHEIDVVERFEEGDGTWLLAVQSNDGREDLAYLVLVPVESSAVGQAQVTDDSSIQSVDTDLWELPVVEVQDDGVMEVDWSELTTDCQGKPMDPRLIDSISAARVPDEAMDDPHQVLLHLDEVALERWVAQVPNSASAFPLAELVDPTTGAPGFEGPVGDDTWLLMLSCSTCGEALPRFVTQLDWVERR